MLFRSPVTRLSMPMTESPRARSVSQRWDPMKPAAPVTTMRATVCRSGALEQTPDEGQPHDLQVERHRPVLDVIEVVFNSFLQRCISTPTVDLGPAGDPGLDLVPQHVLRDAVLELLDEEGALRPRSDDRHLALEHVPELRPLVE